MNATMKFKRLPGYADMALPSYATDGAAGFDLRAAVEPGLELVLDPSERILIATGFAVAVPDGHEMQIRPRSGLALKHGVTLMNAPATIDQDYRGHLQICIVNLGTEPFVIRRGDRIAQAVVAPVVRTRIVEVEELDVTARGERGFGSTGTV